jgi:hypothetical protein
MSEVQNSLLIVLLTGSFTILGFVISALLDFRKEKWRDTKERENRQKEAEEANKKSYLSPLYFYINKTYMLPLSDWKLEFIKIDDISSNLKAIEELMKNNMHILPMDLNMDLSRYVSKLELLIFINKEISQEHFNKLPKSYLDEIEKLNMLFNQMKSILLGSIYSFMKFNILPNKNTIDFNEKHTEVIKILDKLIADSTS